MTKIILLVGPPCSGKTTWAKKYQKDNPGTIVLSRDAMRTMMTGKLHGNPQWVEDAITSSMYSITRLAYERGTGDVIIDQTNCRIEYLETFVLYSRIPYEIKIFDEPLSVLRKRNQMRAFETHTSPIPDRVLVGISGRIVRLKRLPEFISLLKDA